MPQPTLVRNILEAKIHQAFTVAADELLMRGYIDRDTRIALSGVIGNVLGDFGTKVDAFPQVSGKTVAPDDVAWLAISKEKNEFISVFKQASGDYRWIIFSSNAYRDRDGETVSRKALEQDVDRMDREHSYGPLRWWHVPGLDIGMCDFNMLYDKMLIESGTFYNSEIAARVKELATDLQISIGFTHPPSEPDSDGVYWNIKRFERSLLPIGRAANTLTGVPVVVTNKEQGMDIQQKINEFLQKFGPDVAKQVLEVAEQKQREAEKAGFTYKEASPVSTDAVAEKAKTAGVAPVKKPVNEEEVADKTPTAGSEANTSDGSGSAPAVAKPVNEEKPGGGPKDTGNAPDDKTTNVKVGQAETEEELPKKKVTKKAKKVVADEEELDETPDEEAAEVETEEELPKKKEATDDGSLGEMTLEQFTGLLQTAMKPLFDSQIAGLVQTVKELDEKVKSIQSVQAQKDDTRAVLEEKVAATDKKIAIVDVKIKEVADGTRKLAQLTKELADGVSELNADMPRGLSQQHRASQSEKTVKEAPASIPRADPVNAFMQWVASAEQVV